MRKHSILALALTSALVGGVAIAKPGTNKSQPPADNDTDTMSFTMSASKGRLGVGVVQISPELRTHFGAPADRGVLVDVVKADSPAAKAGLKVGDLVLAVDGDPATSAMDMLGAMADKKQGDQVTIEVIRAGKPTQLTAALADDPGPVWSTRQFSSGFQPDPRFKQWFEASGMPEMGMFLNRGGDPALKQRLEELEQRLNQLEKKKYH